MSVHKETLAWLGEHTAHETEYRQAIDESFQHVVPIVNANEEYKKHNVLQRAITPDRVLQFKVEWEDDNGNCRINQGYRVQHSNLLGPYKGGTRFHPSVIISVLKFLAYEQSFKNALTGLSLGAAKGGADFNPKEASQNEIRRFCKAYMQALQAHIGADIDVPAGDINVSDSEIGYMYGEYLKTQKAFNGVLSGKPIALGGSEYRTEATGSGVIFFTEAVMKVNDSSLEGKSIFISGAGNVALHAALMAMQKGAVVKTLSNSRGVLVCKKGLTPSNIHWLLEEGKQHKNPLAALSEEKGNESGKKYLEGKSPWDSGVMSNCDIAMPCATQNEIDERSAKNIAESGVHFVIEGANMPCTQNAVAHLKQSGVTYVPGKAANAGGVILSGFEMQQNATMTYRSREELEDALQQRMAHIHELCVEEGSGKSGEPVDYERGANVAAFRKIADAMVASGY
jgi:glutamate dehydrogenase (NADP+)